MIKKIQVKIVLIFLLNVILNHPAQSQIRKYFIISGKIISDITNTDYSSVQIAKNNQRPVAAQIPGHGRFRLELEYNAEYKLTFNKKGFLPKIIAVNTDIPEKAMASENNFPRFLMAVKLFTEKQYPENLYSENHIQHICYSASQQGFARVPAVMEGELVEKGTTNQTPQILSEESKTGLQTFQVF